MNCIVVRGIEIMIGFYIVILTIIIFLSSIHKNFVNSVINTVLIHIIIHIIINCHVASCHVIIYFEMNIIY